MWWASPHSEESSRCRNIWQQVVSRAAIPIVGAGGSQTQKRPNPMMGDKLRDQLAQQAHLGRVPKGARLADVAVYAESMEFKVNEFVNGHYGAMFAIPPLYSLLAEVDPIVVVSTNYDTLLESAFGKREFHLIVYSSPDDGASGLLWKPPGTTKLMLENPKKISIDLEKETVLFKLHGSASTRCELWDIEPRSLTNGTFVLTDHDYARVLWRMLQATVFPPSLLEYIQRRSLFFVGHSLNDIDLHVLRLMTAHNTGQKSWAIQLNPSEWEVRLWAAHGIDLIEMSADRFVKVVRRYGSEVNRGPHPG